MNWTSCSPNVFDCLFRGNEAGFGGGNYPGGGGMCNFNYCGPNVVNCTFSGNLASPAGGAIYCHYYGDTTVTNCILWGDDPNEIALSGDATITVSYSDVQGGWPGEGNIDENPLFWTGPLGDYYLSQMAAGQDEDSPCVNTGSDTAGNLGLDTRTTRTDEVPDSGIVDMGYHYPIVCVGDLDGDGKTDQADLGILLADWGCTGSDCAGDLDNDGDTDQGDLGILLADWGCGT
jgi:predicted outer membrane repeat protein